MYAVYRPPKDSERRPTRYLTVWLGSLNSQIATRRKGNLAPDGISYSEMIPSSDNAYVTWGQLVWIIAGMVGAHGVTMKLVRSWIKAHSDVDDKRFEATEKQFKAMSDRIDLMQSQVIRSLDMQSQDIREIRHLFDEWLLRQLPPR